MRLVSYEGDDHAVEVEEKHEEVEAKLDERFLYNCELIHPYTVSYAKSVSWMVKDRPSYARSIS